MEQLTEKQKKQNKQKKNKKIRGISAKKVGLPRCVSGDRLENWKIKAVDSIIF